MGWVEGMDYLPDGDLVVAEDWNGQLLRIDPFGVSSQIATDVWAYGVTVGPLGRVYAANNSTLIRVDPDTLDSVTLLDWSDGFSPRVVNFSPYHDRMYVGSHDGDGAIYYLELDDDLEPISGPILLATGVGGWYQDGLGVDACGNLYVPVYDDEILYRISPEGEVEVFYQFPSLTPYGHGLKWGTGEYGWSETALYMPQPYDMSTVVEIEIGVPSRNAVED
jgi:hypothetical protein